jgi:hypothetical protein
VTLLVALEVAVSNPVIEETTRTAGSFPIGLLVLIVGAVLLAFAMYNAPPAFESVEDA